MFTLTPLCYDYTHEMLDYVSMFTALYCATIVLLICSVSDPSERGVYIALLFISLPMLRIYMPSQDNLENNAANVIVRHLSPVAVNFKYNYSVYLHDVINHTWFDVDVYSYSHNYLYWAHALSVVYQLVLYLLFSSLFTNKERDMIKFFGFFATVGYFSLMTDTQLVTLLFCTLTATLSTMYLLKQKKFVRTSLQTIIPEKSYTLLQNSLKNVGFVSPDGLATADATFITPNSCATVFHASKGCTSIIYDGSSYPITS